MQLRIETRSEMIPAWPKDGKPDLGSLQMSLPWLGGIVLDYYDHVIVCRELTPWMRGKDVGNRIHPLLLHRYRFNVRRVKTRNQVGVNSMQRLEPKEPRFSVCSIE